jgi:uncharacterized protein YggE
MKTIFFLLILLLAQTGLADALPSEPHIVVSGQSRQNVVPDILRMSMSITETGHDVEVVSQKTEQRAAKLISQLKALGINKKDITASHLRVVPHYNWQNREQVYVGTEVSRTIEIILRDLGKYDVFIRTVLESKVGQIHSTRLESSKKLEIRKLSLQAAIEDARAKAELLVSNIPEKLGSIYSISQQSSGPVISQRRRMAYQAVESADTSFEPGVIELSESVTVVYYLKK